MITRCRKLFPHSLHRSKLLLYPFSTTPHPPPSPNLSPSKSLFTRLKDWKNKHFRPPSTTKQDIITDKTIRRQLINDAFQIPIKTLACFLLPSLARGPFFAELMRSVIDFLNHLSIWFVNSVNFGPSSSYPYGLEKIKNILSHTVAMLFAASGVYNLHESYTLFLAGSQIVSHEGSVSTALLYLLGIGIECTVIYFNIKGTQELKEEKTSIFSNWANGIQDPLLKVILTENILTLTSMIIPLICQGITTLVYPSSTVTAFGVLLMGAVQVYLSVHLYLSNMLVLAGDKSIQPQKISIISQIIKKQEFVVSLNSIIGVWIDSEHFRLYLDITVDHNKMIDQTSELYQDMIEQASNIDDVISRKQYTLQIANEAHIKAISQVRLSEDKIRKSIQQQYPQCKYIQISFHLGEQPVSPYPLFENLEEDNYRGVVLQDPQLKTFLDNSVSKMKKIVHKATPVNRAEYMSNRVSKSAVERFILLEEDIQFKLLNDSLKEEGNRRRNEGAGK